MNAYTLHVHVRSYKCSRFSFNPNVEQCHIFPG